MFSFIYLLLNVVSSWTGAFILGRSCSYISRLLLTYLLVFLICRKTRSSCLLLQSTDTLRCVVKYHVTCCRRGQCWNDERFETSAEYDERWGHVLSTWSDGNEYSRYGTSNSTPV